MATPLDILMNAKLTVEQAKLNGIPINFLQLKIEAIRNPGMNPLEIPPLVLEPSKARALLQALQQAVEQLEALEAAAPTIPAERHRLQ